MFNPGALDDPDDHQGGEVGDVWSGDRVVVETAAEHLPLALKTSGLLVQMALRSNSRICSAVKLW